MKVEAMTALENQKINTDHCVYFENDCLLPFYMLEKSTQEIFKNEISDYYQDMLDSLKEQSNTYWNRNQKWTMRMISMAQGMLPYQVKDMMELAVKRETITKIVCGKTREIT